MSLRERIHSEMTAAMREHDAERRDALRMILAGVQRAEKEGRHELSDEETQAVLARELKVRRESADAFRAGGREDLLAREEAAIAVIGEFLPRPLTDAELEALVREAIATTGAASPRDMGKVMGWLSPRIRGRADGRHASELVARTLGAPPASGGA